MIDKEISNGSTLDTDLDQNITTNVTSISSVFTTGNLSIKSIEDGVNNNNLSIPIAHSFPTTSFESSGSDLVGHTTTVNLDRVQSSNKVESLVLEDEADNTSNGNLNHPRCISQSSNPDGDVPKKVFKKCMRNTISTSSIIKHKTLCYKIFIILAMCCIIGIFSIPIIAYYVNQTRNNAEVDTEYSQEINTSNVEVCYEQSIYCGNLLFV